MQQNQTSLDRRATDSVRVSYATGRPADTANTPGLFAVLWRQRIVVGIPILVLMLLAVIYLITEPNRYQSIGRLTVTPAGSRLSGDNANSDLLGNFLYTQSEKMLSREILALALAQPVPADVLPEMAGKQIRDLETFKVSDETPLKTIKKFAEVSVGKKDDALTVTYESPFQNESPVITNAIIQAFMKYQTQPKQSNVIGVLDAYHAEKLKVDAEVAQLADKMAVLERKYGVLTNNGDDNLAIRQLAAISQQLATAHSETLRAKGDADEAMRMTNRDPRLLEATPTAIASADDEQILRANLTLLQTKLSDMRARYLPDHPAVLSLQQKFDQAAANYCQAVERRYLRAKAAEDDYRAQFDQQQKRAMEVSEQAAVYGHLKDDSDRVRRLLETLDTRIHGVELQQAAGAVDIDFFDPADALGARKSHPSKVHAFGLALIVGLLLGCGLGLFRDYADDRLHSADEIKNSLGMPMLGVVPKMADGDIASASGQKAIFEPDGDVAESFRTIRTAINFGAPKDRNKTMLVTSPRAGDGKSTAAANLAAVMAQSGKKVLLIDADLRNPTLNQIFGLKEGRPGLSSLLNGKGTWEQSIQGSSVDGLDLMGCGPKTKNPSEVLNSPLFGELLEMAAEKYDHIIIDSPPVMGLADARIIAANCDLTVLVLRASKSTRKLAILARDGLAGVGARLLGVIVNDVSRRTESEYGSGYHYPTTPRQSNPSDEGQAAKAFGR